MPKVLAAGKDPKTCRGEAVTIGADHDAREILRTMAGHKVRRLPVIDGHQLVGIMALAEVARAVPDATTGDLLESLTSG